jgi:1-acyl-sn-glycerol-3-phosphate acyltransferase
MRVRRAFARGALRATRWRLVGTVPPKGILVGAPHTSRWDWVAMLFIAWSNSARPQVLIKHTYFRGPFSWILRTTGGIPLDREPRSDDPGPARGRRGTRLVPPRDRA